MSKRNGLNSIHKEIRPLVVEALAQGCELEVLRRSHPRLNLPGGGFVTFPLTPSNPYRTRRNLTRDLRQRGIKIEGR